VTLPLGDRRRYFDVNPSVLRGDRYELDSSNCFGVILKNLDRLIPAPETLYKDVHASVLSMRYQHPPASPD